MQKARRHHTKWLRPLVSTRFQVLFTPLFEVLFTFPSQYLFTIGLSGVFSLAGWCRLIQWGFHRSPLTQDTAHAWLLTCTGLSPYIVAFPTAFQFISMQYIQSYNPLLALTNKVWALPRSLATTCGIIVYFLLLRVLRCFSSPGLPPFQDPWSSTKGVAPFRYLRIKAYLQLPVAFRSLSRLSSPLRA